MSDRRWAVVRVTTDPSQVQQRRGPNIVLQGVGGLVIYKQVAPYTTREQLLIYRSGARWEAQLTGTEGKDVTHRLPQVRWEELYSIAQAAQTMGMLNKLPLQEII